MNISGAEIVGTKVISVKENQEAGTIKDIIYDPKENKVIGFLLDEGGVITEPKVIPFKEIQDISKEAVLVKSLKSIKPASKAVKPIASPEGSDTIMQNTRIVSEDGHELGIEKDIRFDSKTGKVQEFEVLQGVAIQQVKVARVITSSESTTIIKTGDEQQESKESGGIVEKVKTLIGN